MPWKSLSTRFATVPLVIAGPMLRKVTPTSVTVWVALKEKATDVTLSVLSSDVALTPALFFASSPTVAVGTNLHIVAVTARAGSNPPLTPGNTYFYDLSFTTASGSFSLLGAVGGNDPSVYAYGNFRLPSFELPPVGINNVRLMQGSCRKPNALPPDALTIVDQEIALAIANKSTRPHQLILGGDQIYADEVHESLLLMLSDASKTLFPAELMPTATAGIVAELVAPATRTSLIKSAGMTSVDTRSHLMSMGEYFAMYLFVWSDVLWPAANDIPTADDIFALVPMPAPDDGSIAGVNQGTIAVAVRKLRDEITKQRAYVTSFGGTLRKVRRALANIPTYMILDDHEVTDDFNMTREFCENVYGNPLGMRIIRNGLTAYAMCQHWGNAPEQFETTSKMPFNAPAGVGLLQSFATAASNPAAFDTTLKRVLGLHTPAEMATRTPFAVFHDSGMSVQTADGWLDDTSLLFHYSIEAPAYQLIVTDTRTWRSFPRPGKLSGPDLIADAHLAVQIGGTPALAGRQLMVLFSTNFPPCPGIRQAGRDLPALSDSLVYEDFFDSWSVERVDFGRMLAALSRKFEPATGGVLTGPVVVLSGDVHSSSAQRIHYKADAQTDDPAGAPTKANLVIAQLVASAINNGNDDTRGQHKKGYRYLPSKVAVQLAAQPVELTENFIGWNPKTTPDGTPVATYYSSIGETQQSDETRRFKADESIATLRSEKMSVAWGKHMNGVIKPPDFRIRLDYLARTQGSHDAYTPPAVDLTKALQKTKDSALASQKYSVNVREGKQIVGRNNIGEVGFTIDQTASTKTVAHFTVRWSAGALNESVRFDVKLDAKDDFAKYPGEP